MAGKQEQEEASDEITEVAPGILRLQLPIDFVGLGGLAEEIRTALVFRLEILDAPWRPERFEVCLKERIVHASFLIVYVRVLSDLPLREISPAGSKGKRLRVAT